MTTATKTRPATAKRATKRAPRKPRPKTPPVVPCPTVITLPATAFAHAWVNCALALSTDDSRPVLCSMAIEVYGPDRVRLVGCDSYMLMHAFVGMEGDEIDGSVLPVATLVANDYEQHALRLMRWLLTPRVAKEERFVRLTVVEGVSVTIDAGNVTAMLLLERPPEPHRASPGVPVPEPKAHPYPNWRGIVYGKRTTAETDQTRFAVQAPNLARIAKIKVGKVGYATPIRLFPAGPLDPVRFEVHTDPIIRGLVMPVRIHEWTTVVDGKVVTK